MIHVYISINIYLVKALNRSIWLALMQLILVESESTQLRLCRISEQKRLQTRRIRPKVSRLAAIEKIGRTWAKSNPEGLDKLTSSRDLRSPPHISSIPPPSLLSRPLPYTHPYQEPLRALIPLLIWYWAFLLRFLLLLPTRCALLLRSLCYLLDKICFKKRTPIRSHEPLWFWCGLFFSHDHVCLVVV